MCCSNIIYWHGDRVPFAGPLVSMISWIWIVLLNCTAETKSDNTSSLCSHKYLRPDTSSSKVLKSKSLLHEMVTTDPRTEEPSNWTVDCHACGDSYWWGSIPHRPIAEENSVANWSQTNHRHNPTLEINVAIRNRTTGGQTQNPQVEQIHKELPEIEMQVSSIKIISSL